LNFELCVGAVIAVAEDVRESAAAHENARLARKLWFPRRERMRALFSAQNGAAEWS
jgi:hypothetical protein